MRSLKLLLLTLMLVQVHARAQTFTGSGGLVPDNGVANATFNLNVTGLNPATLNSTHGLKTVCININHTYDSDLEINLKAPDGTEIMLFSTAGGGGHNFTNTCFGETATTFINFGSAPFTGSYLPTGNIGFINNGQTGNGNWSLRVFDQSPQDQGTVISWTLTFDVNPPVATQFAGNDLPIISINTNGSFIPDNPTIVTSMNLIDHSNGINHITDAATSHFGHVQMQLHGSSSQQFPKKNYGIEVDDITGNDSSAVLLGMPAQSDWMLYASYTDKSLLNNVLAYQMYRNFGLYAPRTVYADLFINNQYKGVYVLTEKIKKDSARVDISKLKTTDTTGSDVTGGYIIKIDKTTGGTGAGWYSKIAPPVHANNQQILFQYDYPLPTDIVPKQAAYIQTFVDSFEAALNSKPLYDTLIGWRHFADEKSFIRFLLLNEISKNVDGYRISTYLYKTKSTKGGKLFVGPPWDYDIAFHNSNYCDGDKDTGWAYNFGVNSCNTDDNQIPFWWKKMLTDTVFKNNLRCTYNTFRQTVLDTSFLFSYINTLTTKLANAEVRNFVTWPIMGQYVWPNPTPIPGNYAGEVNELKQYLIRRLTWLDANIPGVCRPVATGVGNVGGSENTCQVYPNPFTSELSLNISAASNYPAIIRLMTMDGRLVSARTISVKNGQNKFNVFEAGKSLPAGIYLLQVKDRNNVTNFKVVKQ